MTSKDDLFEDVATNYSKYFHDPFLSTEQFQQVTTQTGAITIKEFQAMLETGIQSDSVARINYINPIYNPVYSKLQFKVRMSSMQNVTAFFGFTNNTSSSFDPNTCDANDRFNGFIINEGIISAVSKNESTSQKIKLSNIDMTDVWLLRMENDKFYARPLPQIYPYFEGFLYEPYVREWRLAAQLSSAPPEDINQYIVVYIRNKTGADKNIEINHITFGEEYVG